MPHIVFLSYAHDDNRVPEDGFTGWVDFFDRTLSIELLERSLDCKLWRDRRDTDPIAFFDEEILTAVRDSQIFIAIVSPRYVEREYCMKELATFVESHGNGARESGAESVLKVVKRGLPEARQPEAVRRKTGVSFFRIDQERNEEIPFYEGFGKLQDKEYWRMIRRIGTSVETRLASAPRSAPEPAAKVETVFLAVTGSDLADEWDELRDELASNGYRIVPDRNSLPTRDDEATQAIEAGLRDACLSVHLIGETAGFKPDGADAPIVHKQLAAADLLAENAGLKRLLWVPEDIQPDDPVHASFMKRIKQYGGLKGGDEILNGDSFEDLKTVVLGELRGRAIRTGPSVETASAPRRIYLIYAEEDEEEALQVYEALAGAGAEVLLPEFAGDGPSRQAHHESQLLGCDGALIYYGRSSHAFVQEHLDALADGLPAGRSAPLAATGVYLAPPVTARKKVFRSQLLDTMVRGFDGPSEDALAPFLDRLAKGGGK